MVLGQSPLMMKYHLDTMWLLHNQLMICCQGLEILTSDLILLSGPVTGDPRMLMVGNSSMLMPLTSMDRWFDSVKYGFMHFWSIIYVISASVTITTNLLKKLGNTGTMFLRPTFY